MSDLQQLIAKMPKDAQARIYRDADKLIEEYRLRLLREALGISQSALAHQMGIKQSTLSTIERGGTNNKLSTIKRYVQSLGGELVIAVDLPDGRRFSLEV